MKPFKMMFKKRKRKNFFFLCLIFIFFILKVKKNYTAQNRANIIKKKDLLPIWSIKNSRDNRIHCDRPAT